MSNNHHLLLFSLALLLQSGFSVGQVEGKASKVKEDGPAQYFKDKAAAIDAYKQHRFGDAEQLFQSALKTVDGNDKFCQLTMDALMDLALVYEKQGRTSDGYAAVTRCIEISRRHYGEDSGRLPPLLDKLSDLAPDPQRKIDLLKDSVKRREALVGKNDASLVQTLHRLICAQSGEEQTETRRRYWEIKKRLPDFRQNNNAPNLAYDLATAYLFRKDYDQALKFAAEGVSLAQEQFGKNNPIEFQCKMVLLLARRESGKSAGKDEIGAAIEEAHTIVPEGDPYGSALVQSCSLLSKIGDKKHAAQLAELMIKSIRKATGIGSHRIFQSEMQAAVTLWVNGQTEDAIKAIKVFKSDVSTLVENKDEQLRIIEVERENLERMKIDTLAAVLK